MSNDQVPLYVRLSADPNRRLERAVAVLGKSKRQLVEEAVTRHLGDDGLVTGRDGLVIGHASVREYQPASSGPRADAHEVLTLEEAAALLRVDQADLDAAAGRSEVPGRQIAGTWRFSRAALLRWLQPDKLEPR